MALLNPLTLLLVYLAASASALVFRNSKLQLPLSNPKQAAPFKHPGVFVSRPQLDFVKTQVQAKAEPWTSAWNSMLKHELASPNRKPSPRAAIQCDAKSGNDVGNGCHNERQDALAAYANALAWYISGEKKHADKAISYLDGWSAVLQSHAGSNANLQLGWAGTSWVRAAELIRHTGAGWSDAGVAKFEDLLRTKFLPTAKKSDNRIANWDLSRFT
jgi:hypothetical protein